MPEREIKAKEVLIDIRSGMSDEDLMKKYRLSRQGLQNLFDELSNLGLLEARDRAAESVGRKRIRIREIVQDISTGMRDAQLMEKYHLSSNALQYIFKKLLDLRAISRDALFGEVGLQCDSTPPEYVRELQRYTLDFEIPVYETGFPELQGRVKDLTEKGVGTAGIDCRPDEIKTLVVLGDAFGVVAPFEFEALCRWSRVEDGSGEIIAGFQILDITEEAMEELRKVIKLTTLAQ